MGKKEQVTDGAKGEEKPKVHPPRTAETRRQEKLEKRRKKQLLRQQAEEKARAEAIAAGLDPDEALKPKKKKKRKRSDSSSSIKKDKESDEKEGSAEDEDAADKPTKKKKREYTTFRAFVGQIPFHATEEKIKEHFEKHGCGEVIVRLLRRKDGSKRSRGIAFVEVESASQLVRVLRAHHTRLDGKMINVERTCGGGGNSETRKEKLKELKEVQGSKVLEEVKAMVEEAVEKSNGNFAASDIDDRALDALASFPREITKAMLDEYKDMDFEKVNNKSAWFMGMIKRYRIKLKDGDDYIQKPDEQNNSGKHRFSARGRGGFRGGRGGGRGGAGGRPHSNKLPVGGFGRGRGGMSIVRNDRLGSNRGRGYAQKAYRDS